MCLKERIPHTLLCTSQLSTTPNPLYTFSNNSHKKESQTLQQIPLLLLFQRMELKWKTILVCPRRGPLPRIRERKRKKNRKRCVHTRKGKRNNNQEKTRRKDISQLLSHDELNTNLLFFTVIIFFTSFIITFLIVALPRKNNKNKCSSRCWYRKCYAT